MSNIKKSLDDIFDVEPTPEVKHEKLKIDQPTIIGSPQEITSIQTEEFTSYVTKSDEEYEHDDDFATARKNIQELTEKGKILLDGIMDVASDTDKPSAYETAAVLIKTLADANKDLYDLHKKRKQTRGENPNQQNVHPANQINADKAVIYVGTTADLLKEVEKELKLEKK